MWTCSSTACTWPTACGDARIDDGKMTRLIYVKVQETLAQYPGFSKKKVLVVHTGPGNTRVLLFQKGRIVRYSCYRLGTHRTGEAVGEIEYGDDVAELSLLREHMRGQVDQICLDYGGVKGLAGLIVIGQEMQQLRDRLDPTPEGKVAWFRLGGGSGTDVPHHPGAAHERLRGGLCRGGFPSARRADDGDDCPQPEPE